MTGDGPPFEPVRSGTDWSRDRLRTPEPPERTEPRRPGWTRISRRREPGAAAERQVDRPDDESDDVPGGELDDVHVDELDDVRVDVVGGGPDDHDVREIEELEARLERQRASLQNVVDRYEAIIEQQQSARADGRVSTRPRDGLLDAARERAERFLVDVRIAIDSRLG